MQKLQEQTFVDCSRNQNLKSNEKLLPETVTFDKDQFFSLFGNIPAGKIARTSKISQTDAQQTSNDLNNLPPQLGVLQKSIDELSINVTLNTAARGEDEQFKVKIMRLLGELSENVKSLKEKVDKLTDRVNEAIENTGISRNVSIISESELIDCNDIDLGQEQVNDKLSDEKLSDEKLSDGKLSDDKPKDDQPSDVVDESLDPKKVKFVFEYEPFIDLNKWLKKSD